MLNFYIEKYELDFVMCEYCKENESVYKGPINSGFGNTFYKKIDNDI